MARRNRKDSVVRAARDAGEVTFGDDYGTGDGLPLPPPPPSPEDADARSNWDPLDALEPQEPREPEGPAGAEDEPERVERVERVERTMRARGPDGTITTVRTVQAAPTRPAPAPVAPPQRKRRSALDLLVGGAGDSYHVVRIGPKSYRGNAVQCADCGPIPASTHDIKNEIKKRWGGGKYEVRGYLSDGAPKNVPITIAGKPLPIEEEDEEDEEVTTQSQAPAQWTPIPGHPQGGFWTSGAGGGVGGNGNGNGNGGNGGNGWNGYPPGGYPPPAPGMQTIATPWGTQTIPAPASAYFPFPSGGAADDDEEVEEKRRLQAAAEAAQREAREREREAQRRADSMLSDMLKMVILQGQKDAERWDREFKERQLQLQAEKDREERRLAQERLDREQRWKEQQTQWERDRTEKEAAREREDARRREEAREGAEREERRRKEDADRAEKERTGQKEFYERLFKTMDSGPGTMEKTITAVQGFMDVAERARAIASGEEDPATAKIKAWQDAITSGLQAARPLFSAAAASRPAPTVPQPVATTPDPALLNAAAQAEAAAFAQAVATGQLVPVQGPSGERLFVPAAIARQLGGAGAGGAAAPAPSAPAPSASPSSSAAAPPAIPAAPPAAPPATGETPEKLATLLDGLTRAIEQRDPPEWSMGRLQDFPSVLAELREVESATELALLLEAQRSLEGLPETLHGPLDRFVAALKTTPGKRWIEELLDVLAAEAGDGGVDGVDGGEGATSAGDAVEPEPAAGIEST